LANCPPLALSDPGKEPLALSDPDKKQKFKLNQFCDLKAQNPANRPNIAWDPRPSKFRSPQKPTKGYTC
jgi:hypothetical protein